MLTGKKRLEETINYLWYGAIIILLFGTLSSVIEYIVIVLIPIPIIFFYIKRWPPFTNHSVICGRGTHIPKLMKIFNLFIIILFISFGFILDSNVFFTLGWLIHIFALRYYTRVKLPPPKKESVPEKIKKLLEKLKPAPKPLSNPTS